MIIITHWKKCTYKSFPKERYRDESEPTAGRPDPIWETRQTGSGSLPSRGNSREAGPRQENAGLVGLEDRKGLRGWRTQRRKNMTEEGAGGREGGGEGRHQVMSAWRPHLYPKSNGKTWNVFRRASNHQICV